MIFFPLDEVAILNPIKVFSKFCVVASELLEGHVIEKKKKKKKEELHTSFQGPVQTIDLVSFFQTKRKLKCSSFLEANKYLRIATMIRLNFTHACMSYTHVRRMARYLK